MDWEERRLARHARSLMPEWDYRLWCDEDNAAIVRKVLPEFTDDYANLPAGVARTDVARCLYMYVHGGVYFDTDYRFFKPLSHDFLDNRCVVGRESQMFVDDGTAGVGEGQKIGNAFLASEPGVEMWRGFVVDVFERSRAGERDILYLAGPHALSIYLESRKEAQGDATILPDHVLFPNLRLGNLTATKHEDTVGVHLCWGSWRNKPLNQLLRNRARRAMSAALSYQNKV
nr:glycosyltransferase [uncultured Sphingomonas sp.]